MVNNPPPQKRVVILGGGCGGVATALWLSSSDELRRRFKVTLYSRGWRLGGKGASGRKADAGQRIEEHGLHIWLGFYNNAFRSMKRAFAALPPGTNDTFTSIEEAFTPQREVVFMQRDGLDGRPAYAPWQINFPDNGRSPGDGELALFADSGKLSGFRALATELTKLVEGQGEAFLLAAEFAEVQLALQPLLSNEASSPEQAKPAGQDPISVDRAVTALKGFHAQLAACNKPGVTQEQKPPQSAEATFFGIILSWGIAMLLGYISDICLFKGSKECAYEALDEFEFRDWLKKYGATDDVLHCGPLQALYDLAFAYPNGETQDPMSGQLAAGMTLRLCEALALGYGGAPLWKMNAGMGDTIFTPLWDALHAQGVEVKLFHAVEEVAASDDNRNIGCIRLRQQAATLQGKPYDPFVLVKGQRCWPSEPDWAQLENGEVLKQTAHFERTEDKTCARRFDLALGQDFDIVVLAMPPEALKLVTPSLCNSSRWSAMLKGSVSVATQAFQLWFTVPSKGLGFPIDHPADPPPTTGFIQPFATWADMSHLLKNEDWPAGAAAPQSIQYFCGPVPMPSTNSPPPDEEAWAKKAAGAWLPQAVPILWPDAIGTGAGPTPVSGFYRTNLDPSELYVQVPPGSLKWRLEPDSLVFNNLYLAGDWTRLPFSGGAVEMAMWSGMVAAQAVAQTELPETTFPIYNHQPL